MAGEGHIPLSCTPSPEDSAPIAGAVSACETEFAHEMEVVRLMEAPRVTAPIADEAWQELLALGDKVDEDLVAADVRLTQGGEPTFVSVDDMEGLEWNTAALGGKKYALANTLLWKLKGRFSPGSLLHYGQGKWYPGEPLPRWGLTLYWRTDGHPVWNQDRFQAKEDAPGLHGTKDAESLAKSLVSLLGLDARHLNSASEDGLYYLWKEGGLPLAADFNGKSTRWRTGPRQFRRGRLYLLPGDSPLGYRLPLDSLMVGLPEAKDMEFPVEVSPACDAAGIADKPMAACSTLQACQ